jgi:hypothetical protein
MDKQKLKLELLSMPVVGPLLRPYFVKRLADQERSMSTSGSNEEIFSKIYRENLWAEGAKTEGFYSGTGTHSSSGRTYVNYLDLFIKRNRIRTMTDVGSGDFSIGGAITSRNQEIIYNGVDVVPELIEHNQKEFGNERIKFYCRDAAKEEIPAGDLLTIRQVLQHLSNDNIANILKHTRNFRYTLITEHILHPPYLTSYNIDKPSGKSTRAGFGSAVMVDKPPFNLRCVEVLRCRENEMSDIVTFLVV